MGNSLANIFLLRQSLLSCIAYIFGEMDNVWIIGNSYNSQSDGKGLETRQVVKLERYFSVFY